MPEVFTLQSTDPFVRELVKTIQGKFSIRDMDQLLVDMAFAYAQSVLSDEEIERAAKEANKTDRMAKAAKKSVTSETREQDPNPHP